MRRPKLFLSLLLITFISIAQEYSYRYYSISDGLPQTQITALFQDSKGFIWVGTKGGLSRFDGVEFENFGIEDGLTSRIVCNISEGRNGKIYVLCDHGLSVFDGNKFTPHPFSGDIRAYMDIADVVHDFEGNTWLASRWLNDWVFKKFKNGVYSNALKEFSLPDSLKLRSLLFVEADSSLWISTEFNGIYYIKNKYLSNIHHNILGSKLIKKTQDELFIAGSLITILR